MNQERNRPISAEDVIRRYDLENLKTIRKTIQNLDKTIKNQYMIIKKYVQNVSHYNNQVNSTTWFYSGVPTLDNEPYISFDPSELSNRVNDLYYDRNSGKVYIFTFDDPNYSWEEVSDDDLIESLAIANSESDSQDNRRNIFYETPTTPYEAGDIWINDNLIMRCRCSRDSGDYSDTDWIEQEYYSEASVLNDVKAILNQFEEVVTTNYATKAQLETTANNIQSSVESTTTTLSQRIDSVNTYAQEINTTYASALEEMDRGFNLSLSRVEETITSNNDAVNSRIDEIKDYLTYQLEIIDGVETGVLTLGASSSNIKLKLVNNIVYFEQNGNRVAYISNDKLYITDSEFLNSLKIGNFAFIPRSNGSLGFKKVS